MVGILIISVGHIDFLSGAKWKSTNKELANLIIPIPTTTRNHPYCARLALGIKSDYDALARCLSMPEQIKFHD